MTPGRFLQGIDYFHVGPYVVKNQTFGMIEDEIGEVYKIFLVVVPHRATRSGDFGYISKTISLISRLDLEKASEIFLVWCVVQSETFYSIADSDVPDLKSQKRLSSI